MALLWCTMAQVTLAANTAMATRRNRSGNSLGARWYGPSGLVMITPISITNVGSSPTFVLLNFHYLEPDGSGHMGFGGSSLALFPTVQKTDGVTLHQLNNV